MGVKNTKWVLWMFLHCICSENPTRKFRYESKLYWNSERRFRCPYLTPFTGNAHLFRTSSPIADASRRRWINWIWTSASAASAFEEAPTWECQLATFNYGQVRAHSLSIPFLWGWWETDVAFLCDWHFHQTLKETRLSKPRLKKEFVPLLCARAVWESWLGCQTIGFPDIPVVCRDYITALKSGTRLGKSGRYS